MKARTAHQSAGPGRRSSPETSDKRPWRDRLLLGWDFFIIVLVCINLGLIIVDLLFAVPLINTFLAWLWPMGHDFYGQAIHRNFTTIDLGFVVFFVLDVLLGWALAVVQKRYYRWFFYPFIHWYDVLGCIPIDSFRFLRILRVVAIIVRLQRLNIVEVRNWWGYQQLQFYYNVLLEEISDRVVAKVLSAVQEEVRAGGKRFTQQLIRDVVLPRRYQLTSTISSRAAGLVATAYQGNRSDIQGFANDIISRTVRTNATVQQLGRMPVLGGRFSGVLDEVMQDTVNQALDEAVAGLSSEEFEVLASHAVASVFDQLETQDVTEASGEVSEMLVEVLELVKKQVAVKRWHQQFE